MDKQSEYLRKQYQSKGVKQGTSLKLLVDVDRVMSEGQRQELLIDGISTLEEFYEHYHEAKKNNVNFDAFFVTLNSSKLEQLANTCEKYFTDEEKDKPKNLEQEH